MLTCTFFGHHDTPKEIEPTLMSTLVDLIENKNVLKFYIGNHGSFDYMVRHCLAELKENYYICCGLKQYDKRGEEFFSEQQSVGVTKRKREFLGIPFSMVNLVYCLICGFGFLLIRPFGINQL